MFARWAPSIHVGARTARSLFLALGHHANLAGTPRRGRKEGRANLRDWERRLHPTRRPVPCRASGPRRPFSADDSYPVPGPQSHPYTDNTSSAATSVRTPPFQEGHGPILGFASLAPGGGGRSRHHPPDDPLELPPALSGEALGRLGPWRPATRCSDPSSEWATTTP